MIEIQKKLAGNKDFVNWEELKRIETKMGEPERVICPFNELYWQLSLSCAGYHYVCPGLDRALSPVIIRKSGNGWYTMWTLV